MKKALITGSGGLIGSEAARFFAGKEFKIIGIDNDMRRYFFGKEASTKWNIKKLKNELKGNYRHYDSDIRNIKEIEYILRKENPEVIIHAAA
ncbi:MAG: GDP-mannose 4,6-dehydratase, partial [Candidatus Omnitrophota bacterium]